MALVGIKKGSSIFTILNQTNSNLQLGCKSNLTVLIVHKEDSICQELLSFIPESYNVIIAETGLKALSILLDHRIDLVVASIQLIDITGMDICNYVKQHVTTERTKVILIGNNYNESEEEEALAKGAIEYLTLNKSNTILINRLENHFHLLSQAKAYEQMSKIDSMTGVSNRLGFDERLREDWRAMTRGKGDLSLIMIDVDKFKQYNDSYGHPQGDKCLIEVAQCIARSLARSSDFIARVGGEEFAVILPFTDIIGAIKVAQKLVDDVAALKLKHSSVSQSPFVTISAGVSCTTYKKRTTAHFDIKRLIQEADNQLYLAKSKGRNQISYVLAQT